MSYEQHIREHNVRVSALFAAADVRPPRFGPAVYLPGLPVTVVDMAVDRRPGLEESRVPLEPLRPISAAAELQQVCVQPARATRAGGRGRRALGARRIARLLRRGAANQPCALSATLFRATPRAPQAARGERLAGRVLRGTTVVPPLLDSRASMTLVEVEGGGGIVPLAVAQPASAWPTAVPAAVRLYFTAEMFPCGMSVAIVEPAVLPFPNGLLGMCVTDLRDLRRGSAAAVGVGARPLPRRAS